MTRLFIVAALLSACASTPDDIPDQVGHAAEGYALACEMSRWGTPEERVEIVMAFAHAREDLQHPGECNEGCQLDLANWRLGAKAGAICGAAG